MVNHSSIKYISSLLNNPDTITTGDQSSIALFRQTFPYFVPVRYLAAMESNKHAPFSAPMLSEIQPYLGDWILFCDFLHAGNNERKQEGINSIVEEEMKQEQDEVADIIAPHPEDEMPPMGETVIVVQGDIEPEEVIAAIIEENGTVPENVIEIEIHSEPLAEDIIGEDESETLISPVYMQDYFRQLGEKISEEIPDEIDDLVGKDIEEEDKSLMVMMSFSEWLLHFKNTSQKQQEEKKDQKALKTMWQKEKLAAALEEENEEIPENVFEMAVNSITKEDGLASETLAEIYIKQEKYDQAIEMYKKLSLRNPQKSAYFARKIEEVLKEK